MQVSHHGQWQYEALETLLKGKVIRLPDGASFRDKDDTSRHNIRAVGGTRGDELQGCVFRSRERQHAHPR